MSTETVKVKESDLVALMEGIVKDAVAEEKKKWIAEQASKEDNKVNMLESKVAKLEKLVNTLTEGK